MRSELLMLSMEFTRTSISMHCLLTGNRAKGARNVPSFNGLGISISEKSKIGDGMSDVGGVESIKCNFCPVAGGRGNERIVCAIHHFARRCSGEGSGGGPPAKEADEEGGRIA